MKEPTREQLEAKLLQKSANMYCACGKRSCGDKQKVLKVESRFSRDVLETVGMMECQVCKQVHKLGIRESIPPVES